MKWDELSSGSANLLEHVDIIKSDVEYKIGDEISFRYEDKIDEQTIKDVIKFQKFATNSKGQQCYSAELNNGLLKVKYLADGLE